MEGDLCTFPRGSSRGLRAHVLRRRSSANKTFRHYPRRSTGVRTRCKSTKNMTRGDRTPTRRVSLTLCKCEGLTTRALTPICGIEHELREMIETAARVNFHPPARAWVLPVGTDPLYMAIVWDSRFRDPENSPCACKIASLRRSWSQWAPSASSSRGTLHGCAARAEGREVHLWSPRTY